MVFLAACASKPEPPPPPLPTVVLGLLTTAPNVNPDINGRPSPVVVRLYDLKTTGAFDGAEFFSLWDKDQATLGQEMTSREEYTMAPVEQRKFERHPTDSAPLPYVGVVAALRDIEHTHWRAKVAIPLRMTTTLVITVNAGGISIQANSVDLTTLKVPSLDPNAIKPQVSPPLPHIDVPGRP